MPLVSQTFDQLLDFTRTTSGTFVGSNGLLQTTPASVNLLTQTQQFDNAAWTKNAVTVTANTTVAPDGTSTADTITESATNDLHAAFQTSTLTALTTHTMSVYVQAGTRSFAMLRVGGGGFTTGPAIKASLTGAGSTTTLEGPVVSSAITPVGGGWYRVAMTFVSTATTAGYTPQIGPHNNGSAVTYLGDGSGIFIWGAQLEAASAATTYTRNNGGRFPPRFDYDPVTLAPKGLLSEEQRTNLALNSAFFTSTVWAKIDASLTTGIDDPAGGTSATTLTATAANGTIQQAAISTAGTYSVSIWIRRRTGTGQIRIRCGDLTLIPITITSSWVRYTATAVATTTTIRLAVVLDVSGDEVDIWGGQIEAGAFPTSYIPTAGASTVTRTGDFTSIVAPNFAPWYNATEGTFVFEYSRYQNADAFGVILETKPTSTNTSDRFAAAATSTADPRMQLYPNGSSVLDTTSTFGVLAVNTVVKGALAYRSGDSAATRGGASPSTSATAFATPAYTNLQIGSTDNGTYGPVTTTQLNGHIRSIRYYPVRLSNAQLQALTA